MKEKIKTVLITIIITTLTVSAIWFFSLNYLDNDRISDEIKQVILFEDFLIRVKKTMEACYKYGGYERLGYEPNKKYSQECASSVYLTEEIRTTVAKPELREAKKSLLKTADLLDEYNRLIIFASQQEYLNKVDSTYNQLLESITETKEKLLMLK